MSTDSRQYGQTPGGMWVPLSVVSGWLQVDVISGGSSPAVVAATTTASVPAATTVTTLLAANPTRRGMTLYNDSTAKLFLKAGSAASLSDFTIEIVAGGYYELPFGYTGIVTGLWDAVNGAARITEFTA